MIYLIFDLKLGNSTEILPRATKMLHVDSFLRANVVPSKVIVALRGFSGGRQDTFSTLAYNNSTFNMANRRIVSSEFA